MIKKIKIIGVNRCCRQKLLQKMYQSQEPFRTITDIALIPAEYRGRKTLQLFANDIDIGFLPEAIPHIDDFSIHGIICEPTESPTGRIHYNCFLIGQCIDSKY